MLKALQALFALTVIATVTASSLFADENTNPNGKFGYGYITPHVAWAKPYAKGKMNVLFVAPIWTQREAIELWERVDIGEIFPIMTMGVKRFAVAGRPADDSNYAPESLVLAAVDRYIPADWQVAVVGKALWSLFPDKLLAGILSRVKEGAGLVIVEPLGKLPEDLNTALASSPLPDTSGYFRYCTGWTELPYLKAMKQEDIVSLRDYGKGRIVVLRYDDPDKTVSEDGLGNFYTKQSITPSCFVYNPTKYRPNAPDYEYYISLVARAVLWAGRKESEVAIQDMQAGTELLQREGMGAESVAIVIENRRESPIAGTMLWTARDLANRIEAEGQKEVALVAGKNRVGIELHPLPGGTHYLEITIKEKDQALDWGILPIMVKAPCQVVELDTGKFTVEKGENVRGTFRIEGTLPADAKVTAELWDALGRALAVADAQSDGQGWAFTFPYPERKTTLHLAEVRISDAKGVVSWGRTEFALPGRKDIDDFTVSIWTSREKEPMFGLKVKRLLEYGVDAISPPWIYVIPNPGEIADDALYFSYFNPGFHGYMWVCQGGQPYLEDRLLWSAKDPKGSKTACFIRDTGALNTLHANHAGSAQALAPYGQIAAYFNEEGNLDWYQKDVCLCAACITAFREYLKASYGTIAALNASWKSSFKDWPEVIPATRAEVIANGNFPAWADHRRLMELSYTKFYTDVLDVWVKADPNARPGWGYCPAAGRESDAGFDRAVYSAHGHSYWAQTEEPEGTLAPSFMPRGKLVQLIDAKSGWQALAWGDNGEFFYNESATFTPTLDAPLPAGAWGNFAVKSQEWQEIKRGIGKLAIHAGLADDGVRIYYTPMSVHASIVSRNETTWEDSIRDFANALRHAGIGFRCMSYLQLEKGELNYPDIKVLILPFSQALSAAEAKVIDAFAKSGGVVIADFAPGILDGHCRKLEKSQLSELFPEMKAVTITNVGNGKAAYIGGTVKGYTGDRLTGKGEEKVRAFAALLREAAEIKPRTLPRDDTGKEFYDAIQAHFPQGENNCLILFRESEKTAPAQITVEFLRAGHLYDVREKKYLGRGQAAGVTLASLDTKVIASLPYRVDGVKLTVASTAARQYDWSAAVAGGGGNTGTHIVRLTLLSPDGKEMPVYSENVVAEKGKCKGTLTLALNDPEGRYLLRAEEVISGTRAEAQLTVK